LSAKNGIDPPQHHVLSIQSSTPVQAYIALGANLGDRAHNIDQAIAQLRADPDIRVSKISSLLDNPAVGGPANSPAFLNAVAEIETSRTAQDVLHRLLEIERKLGRVRTEKWSPRTIDLDLLLYGDQVIDLPNLKVPHPRLHEREFVLRPLAEIAPDLVHPLLHRKIVELLGDGPTGLFSPSLVPLCALCVLSALYS
jgi:2-amino-4-hydroxy-6-hydroxymethyldihydropteridine diphosphokinase